MVGTDPSGRGGVASVVTVLKNEGFLKKHNIKYVASHSDQGTAKKLRFAISSLFFVLTVCVFSRPSIVHVHSASRASFFRKSMFLAVARTFGCKTIFHLHGAEFQQFSVKESGPWMRRWIRHTLEKSSAVIALSDSWADFLFCYAPKAKVLVVSNSVKLSPIADVSPEESGRILFLGRVGERKGVFELLSAVSILKNEFPNLRLVLGGDGDLDVVKAAVCDQGIEKYVEILGWVGPEQKALELARASIFTLPSFDEGLPMAMLEAMAAGKAIVVSAVGGIPEAVTDGEDGLLIAPGDAITLAAALRKVMENPELHRKLAVNARKTIEARFSTEIVMEKLSALYHHLAGVAEK